MAGYPYITTGINFFETEPGSLCSAQMDRPSLWYFICLQRALLMGGATLRAWLLVLSLSPQFAPLLSFICFQNTLRFPASSFPSIVPDISTFSVVLIQIIPLSALLFCSPGKFREAASATGPSQHPRFSWPGRRRQ